MARGAVVVILSDGWERGDPALVGREMERLRRLAYRIVWVNPRKAAPAFAPLAGGMAAALPYFDAFVSGHSLAALSASVPEAIAATDEGRLRWSSRTRSQCRRRSTRSGPTMLDLERVAPCMPGAEVLEQTGDDAYKVGIKVKVGPISMTYRGEVEIVERDDPTPTATMRAKAKEARGQGTADAAVRHGARGARATARRPRWSPSCS